MIEFHKFLDHEWNLFIRRYGLLFFSWYCGPCGIGGTKLSLRMLWMAGMCLLFRLNKDLGSRSRVVILNFHSPWISLSIMQKWSISG